MPAASARRTASATFEIRTFDANTRTFTGYASTFGGMPDSYGDVVAIGAFKRTLRERAGKIVMLWQHDITQPIGLWEDIREDGHGLIVRGRLVDTQAANDAYVLLKAGAITGLSIGFSTVQSRLDPDGMTRILTDVELYEISLVTLPANDAARIFDVRTGVPMSATHAVLDQMLASLTAGSLRWARQVDALQVRVAGLGSARGREVAPASPSPDLSLAQRRAEHAARMAHYQHYYR